MRNYFFSITFPASIVLLHHVAYMQRWTENSFAFAIIIYRAHRTGNVIVWLRKRNKCESE